MATIGRIEIVFAIALFSLPTQYGNAAVERIVESFDGDGPFTSVDGSIVGLDNPGWEVLGDGKLQNGGYSFDNYSPDFESAIDHVWRDVSQFSFVERIEIRNLAMDANYAFGGGSAIAYRHIFSAIDSAGMTLYNREDREGNVSWSLFVGNADDNQTLEVPMGTNIAFGMEFDENHPEKVIFFV